MSAQSDIMPDRQEIFSSLYGAYRLARFDENGHSFFNISVEGFWRSFFAALLVAPGYALLVSQEFLSTTANLSLWTISVHVASYTISWVVFPLIAFVVTDMLKLGHRYTALIVAVNWGAVIEVGVLIIGLGLATLLPPGPAGFAIVAVTIGVIVYQWFVIRTALQTTGAIALAFVLFSLLVSLMLGQVTDRLL